MSIEKVREKIGSKLFELGYKKVGKKIFYQDTNSCFKLIKIRKHTFLDKFFFDIGIAIKEYRKGIRKNNERTWTLSCHIKYLSEKLLYKGIKIDKFLNNEIDINEDILKINKFLDSLCDLRQLKKLTINNEVFRHCNTMPLSQKSYEEFVEFMKYLEV